MKWPLLISIPHAGLTVPDIVKPYCILSRKQIIKDGDEQAAEIYFPLRDKVAAFVTTEAPRAIIDMNRAEDDRRIDGVVKTHTIWNEPIYNPYPPPIVLNQMIDRYWRSYHAQLTSLSTPDIKLGIDCHTMAAVGPPIGPDTGVKRPLICLSNADGTCPVEWLENLAEILLQKFNTRIAINEPFRGGYIIRSHAAEIPWLQIEVSRTADISVNKKSDGLVSALELWMSQL